MRISRLKLFILLVMSAIGIWASATVLIIFYTLGQQLPLCPRGFYNIFGLIIHLDCGEVLSSPYSVVFGVPLELAALVYFLVNVAMVFVIAFASSRAARITINLLFVWRFLGVALVPYLVFVELFLLHAICVYCTIMHVAILVDFVVISYLLFFGKNSLFEEDGELELTGGKTPGPALATALGMYVSSGGCPNMPRARSFGSIPRRPDISLRPLVTS